MVIGAKLALALEAGGKAPCLDRLCDRLINFKRQIALPTDGHLI